jgi:hypothetical protein
MPVDFVITGIAHHAALLAASLFLASIGCWWRERVLLARQLRSAATNNLCAIALYPAGVTSWLLLKTERAALLAHQFQVIFRKSIIVRTWWVGRRTTSGLGPGKMGGYRQGEPHFGHEHDRLQFLGYSSTTVAGSTVIKAISA